MQLRKSNDSIETSRSDDVFPEYSLCEMELRYLYLDLDFDNLG